MRNTSLSIAAALAVVLACGCKSKESADTKQGASKPAAGAVSADQMGTFTCKNVENDTPCVDVVDHFDPAVPGVHVTYRTVDLPKSGDTYVIQWIATDVGQAAPANMLIGTVNKPVGDVVAGAVSYTLNSYMTKPTNGWPVGKYRVEVKLGDKLVTTAKFAIQ